MNSKEHEANNLIKKAESKLNTGFFGSLFSSKISRLEEALDYFDKAANIYKLCKKWELAGDTYEKCGKLEEEMNEDAAKYYIEASHCYSFICLNKSVNIKKKALEYYVKQGRFQLAGKLEKEIADKFEEEKEYKKAAESFKKAEEYFSMESLNSRSYQQTCSLKYADICCCINEKEAYPETADIYEKIAYQYLNVPLLKSGAKDLFFKSICVHIAYNSNIDSIESKYENFLNEDPTMINSREDLYVKKTINSIKENDPSSYEECENSYKKYTDLDKWKQIIFSAIKDRVVNGNETYL